MMVSRVNVCSIQSNSTTAVTLTVGSETVSGVIPGTDDLLQVRGATHYFGGVPTSFNKTP